MKFYYYNTAIVLIALLVLSWEARGQAGPSLKVVSPPPPDVSAISKFGQIPVSNFTGVPDISIPIHNIQDGTLIFPISIKYHAGGLKVKDDASEIGLGWSLSASGSITAIVRGNPDFPSGFSNTYIDMPDIPENILSTRSPLTSINEWYYTWSNDFAKFSSSGGMVYSGLNLPHKGVAKEYFNYFNVGSEGSAPDFASDVYILNLGDRSLKFVFDNNFKPVILGDGAVKIEMIPNGTYPDWKVTDEAGTIYYFTKRQFSYSNVVDPYLTAGTAASLSTWHLTKMESATHGKLDFNYLHSNVTFVRPLPSVTETYRIGNASPNNQQDIESIIAHYTIYEQLNIDYIQFSSGKVKFLYDDQRLDLQGGRRLKSIEVRDESDKVVKRINLDNNSYFKSTQSYSGNAGYTSLFNNLSGYTSDNHSKRLKLNGISEVDVVENRTDYQYTFTYNEQVNLPGKMSLSIDHWGFYNGANNKQLGPPAKVDLPSSSSPIVLDGANRDANPAYSNANVLTSVQYPTGATSTFSYENHSYDRMETVVTYHDVVSSLFKEQGSPTVYSSGFVDANGNFTADPSWHGKTLKMFFLVYSDFDKYPPDPYTLELVVKKDGYFLKRMTIPRGGTSFIDTSITIEGGSTYNISFDPATIDFFNSLEIRRQLYIEKASSTSEQVMKTHYLGGLRVSSITNYDPLSKTTFRKKYTYKDGTADDIPIYTSKVGHDYYLNSDNNVVDNPFCYRYGQSVYSFSDGQDAPYFGYGQVQVSDIDAANVPNGMTEYSYNNSGSINVNTMLHYGNQLTFSFSNPIIAPIPSITRGRGDLMYVKTFKLVNSTMKPVLMDRYFYTQNNSTKIWQMLFNQGLGDFLSPGYDGARVFRIYAHHFAIPVNRNTLDRKASYEYDEQGNERLVNEESYQYDVTNGHYQIIRKSTHRSNGDTENVYYKYPQDYISLEGQANLDAFSLGLQALQTRHIVTPIESYKELVDPDFPDNKKYTEGLLNTFNSSLPTLKEVMAIESKTPLNTFNFSTVINGTFNKDSHYTSRVGFTNYDEKGRLLQQSLKDNYLISYIWGYGKQFVIAEIKNASFSNVFYENFEDGNGNSSIDDCNTGHYSFSGSYTKQLTGLQNGNYTLSYKRKLNDTWQLTKQTIVVVNGGYFINLPAGQYDDIRFHPKDAEMTTYTYDKIRGVTSQNDANDNTAYFEYDNLGRLKTIRDTQKNIIKSYRYTYGRPSFVLTYISQQEGIKDNLILENSATQIVSKSFQYLDGLGNLLQTVAVQASPNLNDVIEPIVMDEYGRTSKTYLPYTSGSNIGSYRNDPLGRVTNSYTSSQQFLFYQQTSNVALDTKPFAETIFERSPLNRVIKKGAPGETWQPDNTYSYTSSDRTIKYDNILNESDEVIRFTYDVSIGQVSPNGKYAANQLHVNKTSDEHNREVIEYINKEGKTVLKKVEYKEENGVKLYAETYYIYDDFGSLVVVLPPEAVVTIKSSLSSN
jgi:hypothetical protein